MMMVERLHERMVLVCRRHCDGLHLVLRRRGKHLADVAADERVVAAERKVLCGHGTAIGRLIQTSVGRETRLWLGHDDSWLLLAAALCRSRIAGIGGFGSFDAQCGRSSGGRCGFLGLLLVELACVVVLWKNT